MSNYCPQHGYPLPCAKCGLWLDKQAIAGIIDWIEKHELIKPDENSLTQFEPYYHIESKELKALKIKPESNPCIGCEDQIPCEKCTAKGKVKGV